MKKIIELKVNNWKKLTKKEREKAALWLIKLACELLDVGDSVHCSQNLGREWQRQRQLYCLLLRPLRLLHKQKHEGEMRKLGNEFTGTYP